MKSRPLSNAMRDGIVRLMLSKKFVSVDEKFKDEKSAFAMSIYMEKYSQTELEIMGSLPRNFFEQAGHIKFHISGLTTESWKISKKVPIANSDHYSALISLYPGDELRKAYDKLIKKINNYEESLKELKLQIQSVLYSVRSTNQLFEAWPECKDAVVSVYGGNTGNTFLPAIQMGSINEKLGLKVVKK